MSIKFDKVYFNPRIASALLTIILIVFFLMFYNHENSKAKPFDEKNTLTGRVVSVPDGDNLTLQVADNHKIHIRLAYIDAPEKRQAYGMDARRGLIAIAYNADLQCHVLRIDKYKRTVAECFKDNINVNLSMVERGFAWAAIENDVVNKAYKQAEEHAKDNKLGLWAFGSPTPPWEYRMGGVR